MAEKQLSTCLASLTNYHLKLEKLHSVSITPKAKTTMMMMMNTATTTKKETRATSAPYSSQLCGSLSCRPIVKPIFVRTAVKVA